MYFQVSRAHGYGRFTLQTCGVLAEKETQMLDYYAGFEVSEDN